MKSILNKLFEWMYPPFEIGDHIVYCSLYLPKTPGKVKKKFKNMYLIESDVYGSVMTQWIHRRNLRKHNKFELFI